MPLLIAGNRVEAATIDEPVSIVGLRRFLTSEKGSDVSAALDEPVDLVSFVHAAPRFASVDANGQTILFASELAEHIPGIVRYLMRGLGPDEATTELASYLLFDGVFCRRLMEIGRADVAARRDQIREFLARPPYSTPAQ